MRDERGNVLFLILIAVILFTALAYAVTSSSRGTGDSGEKEKRSIIAAQQTQFVVPLQMALTRIMTDGRCNETQLNFDTHRNTSLLADGSPISYWNGNSPSNGSCHVFSSNGGGVIPQKLPVQGLVDNSLILSGCPGCSASTSWVVVTAQILGVGTDAKSDLMVWLGRPTRDQCIRINETLGVTNPSGEPPYDTFDCGAPFTGSYPACTDPMGNNTAIRGKDAFCVDWGSAWTMAHNYVYVQVLLPR